MKKLILTFAFLFAGLAVFSQGGHWKYFTTNVPDHAKFRSVGAAGTSLWLFRPAVTVSATEIYFSKENGQTVMNTTTLSSTGIGLSYQHFKNTSDGKLYNDFGVNALMLFGTNEASLKAALTLNLFQYLNLGAGYDFNIDKLIFITGAVIHFNK